MSHASTLRRLRESAGLSAFEFAELVGLDPANVEAYERGERYIERYVFEQCANTFGMTRRALLAGEDPGAVAVLFRAMHANQALAPLVSSGIQEALGSFVRAVRERTEVRRLLGEESPPERLAWLERIPPAPPAHDLHKQARDLAQQLRAYLRLEPHTPIRSMLEIARSLGITVLFVVADEEAVAPEFDGAALLDPDPAILVNLPAGGGPTWWRTRMIVAHELCHLLHDRRSLSPSKQRSFFLFSPRLPRSRHKYTVPWQLVERFQDMEMRANAFAGELLAPAAAVRALVGSSDPTGIVVIQQVSDHFGIGTTTAVNRLRDTFALSGEVRETMLRRVQQERLFGAYAQAKVAEHPDANPPGSTLHDDEFQALVLRAVAARKLNPVAAREYLGLRLSDPLPLPLDPARAAPLLTPEHRARNAGTRYLHRELRDPTLCLGALHETAEGWWAPILRLSDDGTLREDGELRISREYTIERKCA